MRVLLLICFLIVSSHVYCQERVTPAAAPKDASGKPAKDAPKATIDMYRIVMLERDTVYVDTSLTIQDEYKHNYLRKDIFGLLPFANEGQTYQTLDFGLKKHDPFPGFGHRAKQFPYLEARDIRYYSMATPFTDLYYKSVMQRGQNVDAFVSANISPQLNFSIAYKGLRSDGKYINSVSSTGNFRFTTSYHTKDNRYSANFHFVSYDFLNDENGGVANIEDFESGSSQYKNRLRLNVFSRDAESFLKGKRLFLDHDFRINGNDAQNNLHITHQFNYENKFFQYKQGTLTTVLDDNTTIQRYGASFRPANINDQTHYNRMYNKVAVVYENKTLGKFKFFAEDFRYNYYFDRVLLLDEGINTGLLSDEIQTIGGEYEFRTQHWMAHGLISQSMGDQSLSHIQGNLRYTFNDKNVVSFQYERMNKIPDNIYNLNQSSYIAYNWTNDFNNEKINTISIDANTQWLTASVKVSSFKDMLYFADTAADDTVILAPQQHSGSINYLSVKVGRDLKLWKFGLDNTVLYQQVDQESDIVNVPKFVTRNTLYFQDYYFKKALFIQTGVTFNYFTKYYANDYNPVIGEFYVQNQKEIGDFPMFDFFLDMKIRTARIYFKCEHFNSAWTGNNFLTAPNYPYRDFMIRIGMEWNFFK
ncbi:putative porin [Flavobacterium sp. MAH-1]|uniref:Putative porin n=1 Tax=Flavobacterium agri TaxID=2743471 RepID=A0A7Y8Y3X7_9FLAO|nr:putative porin [Flavobacterium agri]NUY81851.1 putative porin [Flavobacterium agri]NYA71875.1 putative porin [Flavobacterium agri]